MKFQLAPILLPKIMVIAAMAIGIVVILEICAVVCAPVGYQDENGFHIGPENSRCKD